MTNDDNDAANHNTPVRLLRRARIRRVIRDFFQDKPPGTTLEWHAIDDYHRRLREAGAIEEIDRIKLGARVQIMHRPDKDRGYLKSEAHKRLLGDDLTGTVIAEHDSHGLCYEVRLPNDDVITYDREELEVVPSTEEQP